MPAFAEDVSTEPRLAGVKGLLTADGHGFAIDPARVVAMQADRCLRTAALSSFACPVKCKLSIDGAVMTKNWGITSTLLQFIIR
jgi:hypothetical protein